MFKDAGPLTTQTYNALTKRDAKSLNPYDLIKFLD